MRKGQKVIAIGASAGGLQPLRDLLEVLPNDFDAPIVVAIHSAPNSFLTEVLQFAEGSGMKVRKVEDGDTLQNGVVHVVPGAKHAFVQNARLRLSGVVRDSGYRPSIDALFMTLASSHGENAVAVVLSGLMNDGMRGAQVIYDMGGTTIVQDPKDAEFAEMPKNVIRADHPRKVLAAEDLGHWLKDLMVD